MKKQLIALSCAAVLAMGSSVLLAGDSVRVDEVSGLLEKGTIMSLESLNQKALSVQPGAIVDTELDRDYGRYVYEVDIHDEQGREWDVDLDASNGEVLEHRRDD